jgi:beta-galactosidase
MHVMWQLPFKAGSLKAISKLNGKEVLVREIRTAGAPAKINLVADRSKIKANGKDLSFITVQVLDKDGIVVPDGSNLINFEVSGPGVIAGVDNGDPVSHESFKGKQRKAFNGLALLVVQSLHEKGNVKIKATSNELEEASIEITTE